MSIDQRLFRTEAVVLQRRDIGEADRLLTLYSPATGKIRAVAKGVRKPGSRLAGHLELFAQVQVMIAHGRKLDYLTQVQTLEPFLALRNDLDLFARACCLADVVSHFAEEGSPSHELYAVLITAFQALAAGSDPDMVSRHLEMHVLALSGFRPELARCVLCRRDLEPQLNRFSAADGGALCPQCVATRGPVRDLPPELLKSLRYVAQYDLAQALRLRLSASLRRDIETILADCMTMALEKDLKAREFLRILRRTPPCLPAVSS
jgi:DNA repair protein RecO (recombination protein O)